MSTTAFNSVVKSVTANAYKTKNASCVLGLTSASSGGQISEILTIQNSTARGGIKNGLPYESGIGHVKALSGGSFAFQSSNSKWVMLSGNVTSTLSGVSNSTLKSGAAHFFRKAIAFKLTARTAFMGTLSWVANTISGPRYTFTITATNHDFSNGGTDTAAALTRTARSALQYMSGKLTPTETSYSPLTLW